MNMSIAELKLKAIEKLTTLDNEEILKNILNQLEGKESTTNTKPRNLSKHFESIISRYDDTLKKLGQ